LIFAFVGATITAQLDFDSLLSLYQWLISPYSTIGSCSLFP